MNTEFRTHRLNSLVGELVSYSLITSSFTMKVFYNCQFIDTDTIIDLISIGMVKEDGTEYYAINYNCNFDRASDWVKDNVLIQIPPKTKASSKEDGWRSKLEIAQEVKLFFADVQKPELWGWYPSHSFVALSQLYGAMIYLPSCVPNRPNDLKQFCDEIGNPQLPKLENKLHHALEKARWVRDMYNYLAGLEIAENSQYSTPACIPNPPSQDPKKNV